MFGQRPQEDATLSGSDAVQTFKMNRWLPVMGIIGAILYGSLIPFDLNWSAVPRSFLSILSQIGWARGTLEDWLTNLAVYVPLGLTVAWANRGKLSLRQPSMFRLEWPNQSRDREGAGNHRTQKNKHDIAPIHDSFFCYIQVTAQALIVGLLVSVFAESTQLASTIRQPSWTDVVLNTVGSAAGSLLGVVLIPVAFRGVGRVRLQLNEKPCTLMARVAAVGIVLHALIPFDVVTSTEMLHESFRRARWGWTAYDLADVGHADLDAFISILTAAFLFGFLGYFCGLKDREKNWSAPWSFCSTLAFGLGLAVILECAQLFLRSHVFDLLSVYVNVLAVVLGAWAALFVVDRWTRSTWRHRRRLALPTQLIVLGVLAQLMLLFLPTFNLLNAQWRGLPLGLIRWIPFEAMWRGSMMAALSNTCETIIAYSLLAAACAILLRRVRIAYIWWIAGALVLTLATLNEIIQLLLSTGTPDVTTPMLSCLALIMVAKLDRLVRVTTTPVPERIIAQK